ncbi:MAG: DNA polymerase Y family protein [Planctomycetes bacterium]|nr:DNA polymerase Y family protein [Planctomycetota bacterium]
MDSIEGSREKRDQGIEGLRDREKKGHRDTGTARSSRVVVPVVIIVPRAGVLRIVHVNRVAYDLRLRPGQTLADAKAIAPQLITHDDDPAADRRQLEALAVWAMLLSPVVHIEDSDALFVDVTGCEHLFGGEENLLGQAIDDLRDQGFTAHGAIADTPGAAWAIAHAHPSNRFISTPGQVAVDLLLLPVWSLRIDEKTTAALSLVGVETVASLLHLPRSSLASRFGEAALDRLDQALGDLPEVLTPYRPEPVLTERCHFGAPTTRMDILQEALHRTLERFCETLAKRVAGVSQLFVTFYCPDVETEQGFQTRTVTLPVSLSQPTRSARHLYLLLRVLLDKLRLPAPVDSLMLWTRRVERLDGRQEELFATDSRDAKALGDLLDRLAARLGTGAIVKPELLSEHQPERAFRYVPLVGGEKGSRDGGTKGRIRPLRLLSRPLEVAATTVVPEGPPIAFRVSGEQHIIVNSVGPERIETGWWRGPHIRRDYYRAATEDGRRCWLFRDRDTARWFLHGWFD